MRVIISGGGTGGHIYPALAIAEELRTRGHEVLYIGGSPSAEEEVAKQFGFAFASVPTAPLRRNSIKIMADLFANMQGLNEAKRIIREFAPHIAIGTGGFVTAPVLMACEKLHVPTMIHEQNAYPGLANRRLAKKAAAVCLTFEVAKKHLPDYAQIHHTGLPVRSAIMGLVGNSAPDEAYAYFGIDEADRNLPTLLVTGGSQGAKTLNDAVFAAYSQLLGANIRIIHLCGKANYFELKQRAPQHEHLHLLPYLDNMEYALAITDIAIARAGASFLAEAAVLGLPLILVPYPYATNDHQSANAQVFLEADAAVVVADSELSGEGIQSLVVSLFDNYHRLQRMTDGALSLAKTQAAYEIADIAESTARL